MNRKTSRVAKRPTVRAHRAGYAPRTSAVGARRKGRVQAWLSANAARVSIALGWVFAFAAIAVLRAQGGTVPVFELSVFAAGFFGFGVGWSVRDEGNHAGK